MVDLIGIGKALGEMLKEVPLSVVLKERLALLQDQLSFAGDEKAKLQEELAQLKEEVARLRQQVAAQAVAEEFVEEQGALFKRKPGGGYHEVVYCPRCRNSTKPEPAFDMFRCASCKWHSPFPPRELSHILRSLNGGR
jgi:ribosomal protein L29